MSLSAFEIIGGTLSLIFIVIAIIIGLMILIKYFQYKKKILILVGCTWIFMTELWWSSSVSFLMALITGNPLTPKIYFFLGNCLIALGILLWMMAFTELLYKNKQKIVAIIFTIIGVSYEILFYYLVFTDISVIGEMRGAVDGIYYTFPLTFLLFGLFLFLFTGILFARESLRSDNSEIRLKGKFLISAFISFAVGAFLDGLKPIIFPNIMDLIYIINRIILIFCAIEFYFGFILPDWLKKLLLKED
ncbi:MAG: hypothetical protein ACTSUT_16450 [Promethearchaeota archaeon]